MRRLSGTSTDSTTRSFAGPTRPLLGAGMIRAIRAHQRPSRGRIWPTSALLPRQFLSVGRRLLPRPPTRRIHQRRSHRSRCFSRAATRDLRSSFRSRKRTRALLSRWVSPVFTHAFSLLFSFSLFSFSFPFSTNDGSLYLYRQDKLKLRRLLTPRDSYVYIATHTHGRAAQTGSPTFPQTRSPS